MHCGKTVPNEIVIAKPAIPASVKVSSSVLNVIWYTPASIIVIVSLTELGIVLRLGPSSLKSI
ncbi:hypothetical protein [Bacillus cereus]|uniref:hypothetical protein n=1 Tax=Bacillus cereus TaxID=1396 RepID=UPI0015966F92|nr:hypothetical protein [Bacillus cereus]